MTAERDELTEKLQSTEDAKEEVERNLEAMTAERDDLTEKLQSTEDAKEGVCKRHLRLKERYGDLLRKSSENEVRLRALHDRLSFSSGVGVADEKRFSVTKRLLASRDRHGKENRGK
ncbi:myosin heavy chain [Trypanosoma rangeli]|uniref:Myosin heavy chain n=1 Tax=Trypanosoma rangeli TaxID=5698 RepID=A0A422MVI2_TRYRA|nr:myosin heavy chain [Trypanosoma rangeli]RNE97196.1 myosin heavy chain [Trypanosoma rangeli]|eukprot:RNE97196.1 myosin heavy chain [Trypanosoma rangeli]